MWEALYDIAKIQRRTPHEVIADVDDHREQATLSSAIRVYIVEFYRRRIPDVRPARDD
jgi:predicted DNA-binding ribbon-helix-helix protein